MAKNSFLYTEITRFKKQKRKERMGKGDWLRLMEIGGEITAYYLLPLDTRYWNGKGRLVETDGEITACWIEKRLVVIDGD